MDQHRRDALYRERVGHRPGVLQAEENSGEMNRKQLGLLVVLGAVIGALGLVVARRSAASYQSSGAGGAGKKLLPGFAVDDVAHIVIKDGTNELNLVRQEDTWSVRERYGYPANFQEIGDFLRKMWDLKIVQTEEVGPSQYSKLELTEPGKGEIAGTLVEFKDKADKTLNAVLVGPRALRLPGQFSGDRRFPPQNVGLENRADRRGRPLAIFKVGIDRAWQRRNSRHAGRVQGQSGQNPECGAGRSASATVTRPIFRRSAISSAKCGT